MIRVEPSAISMLNASEIEVLHQVLDDISHCIYRIQNNGGERMAEILKNIAQAAISDPFLERHKAGLIIVTLRTLANEANLPPAERRLGFVRGALTYISMLLITRLDVFDYFQAHLADLKKFFGIPT